MQKHDISIVVFDIETSGLQGPDKGGKILEIAAVKILPLENYSKVSEFRTYVNHLDFKVPKKITELTGISDKTISNAPYYSKVLYDFYEFIKDGSILVAHNGEKFDWGRFLKPLMNKYGYYPDNVLLDTLFLSKKAFPGLKSYSLSNLVKEFSIEINEDLLHTAYEDTIATSELFRIILQKKLDVSFTYDMMKPSIEVQPLVKSFRLWTKKDENSGAYLRRIYTRVFYENMEGTVAFNLENETPSLYNSGIDKNIDLEYIKNKIKKQFYVKELTELCQKPFWN